MMNKEKKNIKLNIFDIEFNLISDESEQHLACAANMIDQIMRDIASNLVRPDKNKVATLAALQIASELIKNKEELELERQREKALVAQLDKELSPFS